MSIPRTYSEKYLRGHSDMDLFSNRNTDWMNYPFAKLSYIVLLAIVFFVLHTSQLFNMADTWTVLNMLHGVVSAVCRPAPLPSPPLRPPADHIRHLPLDQRQSGLLHARRVRG